MVVDVVDVDQFPGVDDVADNAGGEGKSHLILLKIQMFGGGRERCFSGEYPRAEI